MSERFELARYVWGVLAAHANARTGPIFYVDLQVPLGVRSSKLSAALKIIHLQCQASKLPPLDVLAISRWKGIPTTFNSPRTKLAHEALLKKVWAVSWQEEPPDVWSVEAQTERASVTSASAE